MRPRKGSGNVEEDLRVLETLGDTEMVIKLTKGPCMLTPYPNGLRSIVDDKDKIICELQDSAVILETSADATNKYSRLASLRGDYTRRRLSQSGVSYEQNGASAPSAERRRY